MNDFNRKVEDASARVSKTVADAAERIEKEIPEFIKLSEFADYMEKNPHPPK
jgi:hypothetical protein